MLRPPDLLLYGFIFILVKELRPGHLTKIYGTNYYHPILSLYIVQTVLNKWSVKLGRFPHAVPKWKIPSYLFFLMHIHTQ